MHPKRRRIQAHAERRIELKAMLQILAVRLTGQPSLVALAEHLDRDKTQLSDWVRSGEVPPRTAALILRSPLVEPKKGRRKIELKDLAPSLA